MPAYADEQKRVHIAQIRKLQTASGQGINTPGRYLQDQLRENGLDLSLKYIQQLVRKIAAADEKAIDTRTLAMMRRQLERNLSVHLEALYQIIYSKRTKDSDKIAAMREARETYLSVYEKREALEHFMDNVRALPAANPTFVIAEPKLITVVDAMIRFGILPPQSHERAIESGTAGSVPPSEPAPGSG